MGRAIKGSNLGYRTCLVAGNGKAVCEAMTAPESRKVIEGIADSEPAMGSRSCPEVMTAVSEELGASEKEALENVEIGEVNVSGNTATAEIGSGAEPARFEKINGSWHITGGGLRLQIIH